MKVSNFLIIFSLLFFMSCGDSNDDINPDNLLLGDWELQSFEGDVESAVEFNGESVNSTLIVKGKNLNYDLTFTESTYVTAGSYDLEGSVNANGTSTSIDQTVSDVVGNGTYTVADDVLTSNGAFFSFEVSGMSFLEGQEEVSVFIETLTEEELVLVQQGVESQSQTINGVTTNSTSDIDFRSVWRRR